MSPERRASGTTPPHPSSPQDMATAAVLQQSALQQPGVNKRYRPTPAKTFQCRGYGECRMVFSRSEHLARHIRKHTGERPFTCHCGKQFSRLDNLRQHAQTVHSDKQDQNERMMRDLTSLHASMAAANKASSRGGRRTAGAAGAGAGLGLASAGQIKVEEGVATVVAAAAAAVAGGRPGTSTGYEGANWQIIDDKQQQQQQHHHQQQQSFRDPNNHSFRDNSQSFRDHSVSPVSPTSPLSTISNAAGPTRGSGGGSFRATHHQQQHQQHHHHPGGFRSGSPQSFLSPLASNHYPLSHSTISRADPNRFSFNLPSQGSESSSSRPTTASTQGPRDGSISLPPLSSVVPTSIPPPPPSTSRPGSSHILPPSAAGFLPSSSSTTATPSSATAAISSSSAFPYTSAGFGWARPGTAPSSLTFSSPFSLSSSHPSQLGSGISSAVDGGDSSPFSFNLPPPTTSRKRSFSTANEGDDDEAGGSNGGRESRPTSRRLTVMELCSTPSPPDLVRPTTTSTITRRAAGLSLLPSSSSSSSSNVLSPIENPTGGTIEESRGVFAFNFHSSHQRMAQQYIPRSPPPPLTSSSSSSSHPAASSRPRTHGRQLSSSSTSSSGSGLRSPSVSAAGSPSPVAVYR